MLTATQFVLKEKLGGAKLTVRKLDWRDYEVRVNGKLMGRLHGDGSGGWWMRRENVTEPALGNVWVGTRRMGVHYLVCDAWRAADPDLFKIHGR